MASKLTLINTALSKIGQEPIQDLNEDTVNAQRSNLIYDGTVEDVISEGNWTSATFRKSLAKVSDKDSLYPEFSSKFTLPTHPKLVRLIRLINYDDIHIVNNRYLYANTDEIIIEYMGVPTSTGEINTYLGNSISDRLASQLSLVITGDRGLTNDLQNEYLSNLQNNLSNDFIQSNNEMLHIGSYLLDE